MPVVCFSVYLSVCPIRTRNRKKKQNWCKGAFSLRALTRVTRARCVTRVTPLNAR